MPEFRCYCLSTDDKILRGHSIEAEDLAAAIKTARELCQGHDGAHPDRIEVWQGTRLLHP